MTDTTTTPNEAEAVTEQALGELEHLDPNDLQVGDNIREYANLNKPFLDSIAEHGVLVPHHRDSPPRRRGGGPQRAAAHHGRPQSRSEHRAGLRPGRDGRRHSRRDDRPDRAPDRHQRPEEDLSNAQRARGIQQMIDAGLTAQKVAKKLSVAKDTVKAAEAAAKSRVALEALESQQITLTEAAVLTEFEQDGSEAIDRLVVRRWHTAVRPRGSPAALRAGKRTGPRRSRRALHRTRLHHDR